MRKFCIKNKEHKKCYEENKRDIICMIGVIFICLFPRIVMCMQAYPLRTRHDELATISAAAYFAGLDWSEVVSTAKYYGTGFTAFLSIFFKLTDDPILIYRSMLCVCSLLQALCGLISFIILKNTFHIKNKLYLIVSSVMCSFMVVTRANIVYNEHMMIIIMWLSTYCLIYINSNEEKKKKRYVSIILAVLLCYSYTVHTRAIVFNISIVLMILFFYVYKRITIVDIKYFIISDIAGMFVAQKYVDWIQKVLWKAEEGQVLPNSQISVINKLKLLGEWNSWKAIFYTIIGQLNTINMVSAGLIIVMLGIAIVSLWKGRKRYYKNDKTLNIICIVLLYCILCSGITIIGQSITWLIRTKSVIDYGYNSNLYGTKVFTYIRYFGPYCGPLIMMFAVFLYKFYRETRKMLMKMFPVQIILQAFWLFIIMPYMAGTTQTGGIEALLCFVGEDLEGKFDYNFFFTVGIVSMLIYFIILFLGRADKKIILMICVTLFLIYQYIYNAKIWDIRTQYDSYALADDIYEVIKILENEGIDVPKQIYAVPEERSTVHYIYYEYQIMLNRYCIVLGYPDNIEERAIICSPYPLTEIYLKDAMEIRLDRREYMYIKGDGFIKQVKDVLEDRGYII